MNLLIKLIGLSMVIGLSVQQSTPESLTYFAGVVEYHVNPGNTTEIFQQNANNYIDIISSPDAEKVDIIVFPEMTLNSRNTAVIVPSETEDIDLCTNTSYDENLSKIACAARDSKKYVVINLTMKRNCTEEHDMADDPEHEEESAADCPSEWVLYNTNVVFDRNGKVISIYRKYNLFGESGITQPSSADISIFTTDFDVTFGHFICFDLMFQSPALDLIDQGIKNIIFPTMWFSELPFLSAVQAQQNWAYANDVNFLGAGANQPKVGSTGSGIYSGKLGALISTMTGEERTRLLVHEVPKIPGNSVETASPAYSGEDFDNLYLKRDQLDVYTFKEIELPESTSTTRNHSFSLCHTHQEELCCEFKIDVALQSVAENSVSYTYFAAVFNGVRTFDGVANGGIQACAVLACRNDDISTCARLKYFPTSCSPSVKIPLLETIMSSTVMIISLFVTIMSFIAMKMSLILTLVLESKIYPSSEPVESKISFQNIVINGMFPTESAFTMPNSLNFNVSPYPTSDFSYTESTNPELSQNIQTKTITMSLLTPKSDLIAFAIYARDFRFPSSGNKVTSTILVVLLAAFLKYLIAL